jgi:hypothetical protein
MCSTTGDKQHAAGRRTAHSTLTVYNSPYKRRSSFLDGPHDCHSMRVGASSHATVPAHRSSQACRQRSAGEHVGVPGNTRPTSKARGNDAGCVARCLLDVAAQGEAACASQTVGERAPPCTAAVCC